MDDHDIIMPFGKRFESLTGPEALRFFKAARTVLVHHVEQCRQQGIPADLRAKEKLRNIDYALETIKREFGIQDET